MIRFECVHCGNEIVVHEKHAGQMGTCRKCRGKIRAPMSNVFRPEPAQPIYRGLTVDCRNCGVMPGMVQPVNHLLHFLIAFFTCGLWVIPWLLIAADPSTVCRNCGAKASRNEALSAAGGCLLALIILPVGFLLLSLVSAWLRH